MGNTRIQELMKVHAERELELHKALAETKVQHLVGKILILQTSINEAYPGGLKYNQPMLGSWVQVKHNNYTNFFSSWKKVKGCYGRVVSFRYPDKVEVKLVDKNRKVIILETQQWYPNGKKNTLDGQNDDAESDTDWYTRLEIVDKKDVPPEEVDLLTVHENPAVINANYESDVYTTMEGHESVKTANSDLETGIQKDAEEMATLLNGNDAVEESSSDEETHIPGEINVAESDKPVKTSLDLPGPEQLSLGEPEDEKTQETGRSSRLPPGRSARLMARRMRRLAECEARGHA